jgi:hypothetical protein
MNERGIHIALKFFLSSRCHRQAALLLQEVRNYQEQHELRHWPCLIAGGAGVSTHLHKY